MSRQPESFSRYLPPDRQSRRWGWRLLDAGRQTVPNGMGYPAPGHPLGYLFDKEGRRTLDEFQIIFITAGHGSFASRSLSERPVKAGDALLLFPGEWHSYRPDPDSNWGEYWLGFHGRDAERVMGTFFSPEDPLHHPAQSGEIIRLFDQLLYWIQNPVPGVEQVLASHIPLILAFLQAGSPQQDPDQPIGHQLVMQAKSKMLHNLSGRTNLPALAQSLGVSYSKFRTLFKTHTGYSPREFENLIKLNRSKDLLKSGRYSVTSTAEELGFSSVFYFSRAFKKQFGQSPREWMAASTG